MAQTLLTQITLGHIKLSNYNSNNKCKCKEYKMLNTVTVIVITTNNFIKIRTKTREVFHHIQEEVLRFSINDLYTKIKGLYFFIILFICLI